MRARVLSSSPFVLLALAVLFWPSPSAAAPVTRRLTMVAQQYGFDPPVLRVNRGDRVIITLTQ